MFILREGRLEVYSDGEAGVDTFAIADGEDIVCSKETAGGLIVLIVTFEGAIGVEAQTEEEVADFVEVATVGYGTEIGAVEEAYIIYQQAVVDALIE